MGVIYTPQELETGAIPQPGAHEQAASDVLAQVGGMFVTSLTVVHGSVATGDYNPRSDLDVLITYDFIEPEDEPRVVEDIQQALESISQETRVKIEPSLWPSNEPIQVRQSRMYDLLFNVHLARSMVDPQWSVGEADSYILDIAIKRPTTSNLRQLLLNYATEKHAKFNRAPRPFDAQNVKTIDVFQRLLELPKAIRRKVEQASGINPELADDFNGLFDETGKYQDAARAFVGLRNIDLQYSDMITHYHVFPEHITPASLADYERWLSTSYQKALRLGTIATTSVAKCVTNL